MRNRVLLVAVCTLAAMLAAQVAQPTQPEPGRTPPGAAQPAITAPANIEPLLGQVEQIATAMNGDIAGLRIDKWKTDSNTKRQAQADAESVQRNLTAALPGMVSAVRSAPDNVAAAFKLYRNLDALYDVSSSLAESAGAFGPKDEYQALAKDSANLDRVRRKLADQVESLANFKDDLVGQLMIQVRNAQAAAAAVPPKKVIVEDEEKPAPKKPARKKKAPAKPAQTQQPAQNPPQQNPPPK